MKTTNYAIVLILMVIFENIITNSFNLMAGQDFPTMSDEDNRPLWKIVSEGVTLTKLNHLLKSHEKDKIDYVNAANEDGMTAIMLAHESKYEIEIIDTLIKNGADLKIRNKEGLTALAHAVSEGRESVFNRLVIEDTNINQIYGYDKNHRATLLALALRLVHNRPNKLQIIKRLLSLGADINIELGIYFTALFFTIEVSHDSINLLKLVLERGANVNIRDSETGMTPLMYAAEDYWRLDAIPLLLMYGADVMAKDKKGKTVYDYLIKSKEDSISYLKKSLRDKSIIATQIREMLKKAEQKPKNKCSD